MTAGHSSQLYALCMGDHVFAVASEDDGFSVLRNYESPVIREIENDSPHAYVRRAWKDMGNVVPIEIAPDRFYARMSRPSVFDRGHLFDVASEYERPASEAVRQLASLNDMLDRVFRVIEPEEANLGVFGHEIRNTLMLACMEVEAQCKGVLIANGVRKPPNRMTIADYSELSSPLKLDQYRIAFRQFPWLEPLQPFKGWRSDASPEWYRAYNAVKHSRELELRHATLKNAMAGVAACVALVVAQFGGRVFDGSPATEHTFEIGIPVWSLGEMYFIKSEHASPVSYPFPSSS